MKRILINNSRQIMFLLMCISAIMMFSACGDNVDPVSPNNEQVENSDNTGDPIVISSDATQIVLNGKSINVVGAGATANGGVVTITSAGTYNIVGSLSDGQIIVASKETVNLFLSGVNISNSTNAPINVVDAEKTNIILADNTKNYITDGASYIFDDSETDEPNAAIFSKDELAIYGNGYLTVDGNYNDGITSKDGLTIAGGVIAVTSVDDGIRGKDFLVIKGGNITVNAGGDGLKSDDDEDAAKGYIAIQDCVLNITAGGDAITAETDTTVTSGELSLFSGGGSSKIPGDTSTKGIKAGVNLVIGGGTITVNSSDDSIHSNGNLTIDKGTFVISSGDDGIHADSTLEVNGGDIQIAKSYEGIESRSVISINGGNIHIVARDDGINVAGGMDGSGLIEPPVGPGQPRQPGIPGDPGQGGFETPGDYYLYINGGYIAIDAEGDGIDSNGYVEMTNGKVIVNGSTENMDGALDHFSFKMTGGFLVAAGSSRMAQAPDTTSDQCSLLLNFRTAQQAGTLFHIQTSEGDEILTFAPTKKYQSIAFSSPELIKNSSYDIYYGGKSTGKIADGLYSDGVYTPGTKYSSFTIFNVVTKIN